MCRLGNIAMSDYQESVTTRQTERQTPDKVIPMCRYGSQATQKVCLAFTAIYDYSTISIVCYQNGVKCYNILKNIHEYFETNSSSARQS